jgi:GNAT superfamily N-acetyltransferase
MSINYEYIGQNSLIKEIPESLVKSFFYEAGGDMNLVHSSPIKLVASEKSTLAGFVTADYSYKEIVANSFYVDKSFRNQGIGKELLLRLLSKAESENLNGLKIIKMTPSSIACVSSLRNRCSNSSLIFDIHDGDYFRHASIRFS